jgi:predicted transcriptional regulator/adenylate kinase
MPTDRFALLSIFPRYAKKILSGEKRLEFRKSWASNDITAFVIYATAPIQKIVGIAYIKQVHQGSATALWRLSQEIGGGVSRRVLYDYFRDKARGFAMEIESVQPCSRPLSPEEFFPNFNPPQSFNYLDRRTFKRIESAIAKQPPKGRVMLIAGVHGVGKTTLCGRLADDRNFIHKSASQLIREEKETAIAPNTKTVADIPGNQQLLIDAVSRITASGQTLLLDGHLGLLNSARKVEPLATKVFADLGIDGIILILGKPTQIFSSLIKRDGNGFSLDEISALQTNEISRAKNVSEELGLPLIRVKAFDDAAFTKAVRTLARNPGNRRENNRM